MTILAGGRLSAENKRHSEQSLVNASASDKGQLCRYEKETGEQTIFRRQREQDDLEKKKKRNPTLIHSIFPRFHQQDSVTCHLTHQLISPVCLQVGER
jgi:hypothetical protein